MKNNEHVRGNIWKDRKQGLVKSNSMRWTGFKIRKLNKRARDEITLYPSEKM